MCQARMWADPARVGLLVLIGILSHGCGGGEAPPSSADSPSQNNATASHAKDVPPVAAISSNQPETGAPAASSTVSAPPGSPEARLLEIVELVDSANAAAQRIQAEEPGAATDESSPLSQAYRQQLSQIIDLATEVIAATHLDPEAEQSFSNAVHYLSDARLELATLGDAEQARLLLEDADSLYERDPDSFAAAEAGFKVVALAERMARSLGADDAEWPSEHARQALQFAERFPDETSRAAMGLYTAGRLCDRYGLTAQARNCLQQVQRQFGGTVFAEQSAGILRRLSLPGQPLELTGATIDGGFVDLSQYAGRPVLVAFWSSTSPTFLEHLPELQRLEQEFAPAQLAIIGVNLDKDEAAVDAFISQHSLTWPQIFSADPNQRGGRNPVARYYGVQILPTYWLVTPEGTVANNDAEIATLRDEIQRILSESN